MFKHVFFSQFLLITASNNTFQTGKSKKLDWIFMFIQVHLSFRNFLCEIEMWVEAEAATRGFLWKKVFLEISKNSQEGTCTRVSFLIKKNLRPATLLKNTFWYSCFPMNFAKFLRTLFYRTPPADCFLKLMMNALVKNLWKIFVGKMKVVDDWLIIDYLSPYSVLPLSPLPPTRQ